MSRRTSEETLGQMVTGYRTSQLVYVAAKLGIADLLRDGPRSVDHLAESASAHPGALYRVLRALAGYGVFAETEPRVFAMTPLAEALRSDVPASVRAYAIMNGADWFWSAWGNLLHSVRTGRTALDELMGAGIFEFLDKNPEAARVFDNAMTSLTSIQVQAIVSAYDFSRCPRVIDIGGGRGSLVTAILRAYPKATATLFDRPTVLQGMSDHIEGLGLTNRCAILAGDFFEGIPAGSDAYVLKDIVHDWPDERAVALLKNCRRAMKPEARLLVIERIIPAGNEPSPARLSDVNMLVIAGGRERTENEYRTLMREAGFRLARVIPTRSPSSILEALPDQPR
jgi:hypothetical protein